MAGNKQSEDGKAKAVARVEKVPLAGLKRKRRSKHSALMQEVLKGLEKLSSESALKVPLGSNSAKDLRSAIVRAAASKSIQIASTSDQDNLYIWRKPNGSKKSKKQEPPSF